MKRDQFEVKGEESERIKRWLDETRRNYPNMVFIDSLDYLHEFLNRSYTYEVGEEAIRKSHLESFLSVPAYFLLPKGENLGQALQSHRCYEMGRVRNRYESSHSREAAVHNGRPFIPCYRHSPQRVIASLLL